ncbi:MAG: response regulator transcription factor [Bacilli bacterium]|nr:response regulator transcription factor [Bacilli bacterium]
MINIAVVEDEKVEQDRVKDLFKKIELRINEKFNISYFNNGNEFLFNFEATKFDLILMDIDLNSDKNGLEVSHEVRKSDNDVIIVFMTNLAQYAIDGYKVNAFDYIIKPILELDFITRIENAISHIKSKKRTKILVSVSGKKVVLELKNIYYVEVLNHNLFYHTNIGVLETRGSLKALAEELKNDGFSLCNTCYLVNLRHVEHISGYIVKVKGDELLISHPKKKSFVNDFTNYLGV